MSEEAKESPLLDVAKVNELIAGITSRAKELNCNLLETEQACRAISKSVQAMMREQAQAMREQKKEPSN